MLLKYMYIFVIFESPVIPPDVHPGFVFYALYVDFRLVNVDILSLLCVLCRYVSYSQRCKPYLVVTEALDI